MGVQILQGFEHCMLDSFMHAEKYNAIIGGGIMGAMGSTAPSLLTRSRMDIILFHYVTL